MCICTLTSAALLLQTSWYIIPVANLSWEVLLPFLSPWVPYIIRLMSAGTKNFISCEIQQFLQYRTSLYVLYSFHEFSTSFSLFSQVVKLLLESNENSFLPSYLHWTTQICGRKVNLLLRLLCFVIFIVILTNKSHSFCNRVNMQFK